MTLSTSLSNAMIILKKDIKIIKNYPIKKLNFLKNWVYLTTLEVQTEKKTLFSYHINYYRSFLRKALTASDLFIYNFNFNKLKYKLNKCRIDISLYTYFSYYTFKKIKIQRYAKNIKKDRFNVLNPLKLKNNNFLNWFCYNQNNTYITRVWKFMLKKNYRNFFFKIKLWPKKSRTLKWKLQLKAIYININIRKVYSDDKKLTQNYFFKFTARPQYFLKQLHIINSKLSYQNIFNWYLFSLDFRLKNVKKLNKVVKVMFFNLSFFQNFPDIYINIFLKSKLPLKKFKLLNWVYREVFTNFYYSKFHYTSKQYFFSFIFLVWYKNIHFLTYFLWDSFQRRINRERSIVRSAGFFLQAMPLKSFGIIGFKLLIKGKLFKRPRKKIYSLRRGLLPLMNLQYNIKYTHYLVWTRVGSFNFHFWLTFTK